MIIQFILVFDIHYFINKNELCSFIIIIADIIIIDIGIRHIL